MKTVVLTILAGGAIAGSAAAQCGDVYSGTWRNPPFGFDIFKNGTQVQFTAGVFDAPDQTPIAIDAAGNLYHAQTIDAQGTVRIYQNNTTLYTYGPRGGPAWVYSGLALAVEPTGSVFTAFYSAATTVSVYRNGATELASFPAVSYQGSAVGLAWQEAAGRLFISVRTGTNQVTIYDLGGTVIATYPVAGVALAARGAHWYAAVPVSSNSVQIHRDGSLLTTISGAFSAGSKLSMAVDGAGSPFIVAGVPGGFAVVGTNGIPLYTLPNTASGGGTGIAIHAPSPCGGCYANCDGSTVAPVLNVSDFICFQSKYAAGDSYANCDASTVPPVLNVSDFICFQQRYAAGCS